MLSLESCAIDILCENFYTCPGISPLFQILLFPLISFTLSRNFYSSRNFSLFPRNFTLSRIFSFRGICTLSAKFLLFPNFYSSHEIFTLSAKFLLFPRNFYSFRNFTLSREFLLFREILLFPQNFYSFGIFTLSQFYSPEFLLFSGIYSVFFFNSKLLQRSDG